MKIEKYKDKFFEKLEILIKELKLNYDLNDFINKVRNNKGEIFLLMNNKDCIGFVSGYEAKLSEKEKLIIKTPLAEINNLYLLENYKKEVNYKLLLNSIEYFFKENGFEYILFKLDYLKNDMQIFEKNGYNTRKITMEKKI